VGIFFHPITVIGPTGERVTVDALVDSGSTFTSLPGETLRRLGVRPQRQVSLRFTDGTSHLQEVGVADVEVEGLSGPTYVVFGQSGSPPAIGATTLEHFLLGIDPVARKLVPVEGWQA
jgi:predicted aspartyl protease